MSAWMFGAAKLLIALQASDVAVVGQVRDAESGEAVAGAIITLTDVGRSAVSDSLGRYALRSIPPGPQHLTVRRIGYSSRVLHALVPQSGELRLDIALRRDPLRLPAIAVRPRAIVHGARDELGGAGDRSVSVDAIRNHPLLAEPDAFLALGGGAVVLRAESPSGVHIGGGSSDQTGYLLDGVPIISPYHAAGVFSAFNPDALERVEVSWRPGVQSAVEALSGTVAATTRSPGARTEAQGSLSTMQARLTLSGPAGLPASTYLVSVRTGFPGFVVPEREPSYLHGESGDLLAKLEVPLLGGRSRLLIYDNVNELGASSDLTAASSAAPDAQPTRHTFEWHSRSAGAEWRRAIGHLETAVQAWSALAGAEALWNAEGARFANLTADRRDVGIVASAAHARSNRRTVAAVRLGASRTRYDVSGSDADTLSLDARLPVASLFIERQQPVGDNLSASLGVTATVVSRSTYLSPHAVLRWNPTHPLSLSGSYARSHQFAQSLRNAESIIGTVFPADLFVGANAPGVPVARADNVVVAAEVRPAEGMRFVAQGYLRKTGGLLLAAPRSSEPFATRAFTTGAGMSRGLAFEGALSAARYGVVASYGWQRARVVHDTVSYTPEHAVNHLIEGGVIVFPSLRSSIRIGVIGAVGRRASGLGGSVENEGCNVLDRGCEFAGTPRVTMDRLGASTLPPYLRVDVGARKHWDIAIAGRTATVALFGTVTNVFGRRNVLAVITDPTTGAETNIGMRPPAPLVVGLDWRF